MVHSKGLIHLSENTSAIELYISGSPTCICGSTCQTVGIPVIMPSICAPLGLPRAFLCPSGGYSEEVKKWEKCHHSRAKPPYFPGLVSLWTIWEASEIINVPRCKFGSFFGVFLKL